MNSGGLFAVLLLLGIVLLVTVLAVMVSEPRDVGAPRTREDPAAITRRLRRRGPAG
jgi:hypothetical protein